MSFSAFAFSRYVDQSILRYRAVEVHVLWWGVPGFQTLPAMVMSAAFYTVVFTVKVAKLLALEAWDVVFYFDHQVIRPFNPPA